MVLGAGVEAANINIPALMELRVYGGRGGSAGGVVKRYITYSSKS